jgi:hypothetical protein
MNNLIVWVPVLISLFLAGANCAIFAVIKFNDMKHIDEAVKRIEKAVSKQAEELMEQGKLIAKIEGKCLANHG